MAAEAQLATAATHKRARQRESRVIPTQHAVRPGGSAVNSTPRPARLRSHPGGNTLPATIEVEKFAQVRTPSSVQPLTVQARAFEIVAMQRAMKTARDSSTVRAFQSLCRHLRRRAASHNIRRLPIRLRAKAASETPKDAAKPKKKTRKMLGMKRIRYLKLNRTVVLLRRQRNKIWLETHIWHAKRMQMVELWGHRLAEKPTAKAFRASYRASVHGALLHDASYHQYLELKGTEEHLRLLLDRVSDPSMPSPGSKRFSNGTRECTTLLYDSYPTSLVGPASVIWDTPSANSEYRQVLVRLHPSIANGAYFAVTAHIAASPLEGEGARLEVGVFKCEKEFLTFEITGKRATEVVKAVLRPTLATDEITKQAWRKLSSTAGPAGVPAGMVFALEVYDPRLSFPPKLDRSNPANPFGEPDILQPSIPIASCPSFWDAQNRLALRKPRFKKSDIDARRSQLLIPGTILTAEQQDARIPVLLSQRTLSPASSRSTNTDELAGWTLTIPSGWGMAFFSSLVFSETRVAGQRERDQSFFEAGSSMAFPRDFPGCKAFQEHETRRRDGDESYWERRPAAKRCNFAKAGVESPFEADFAGILARAGVDGTPWIAGRALVELVGEMVTLERPESIEELATQLDLHLARTRSKVIPRAMAAALSLLQEHHRLGSTSTLLGTALVRVRITPCDKGAPEELGLIYSLEDESWTQVQHATSIRALRPRADDSSDEHFPAPPSTAVIGRITTGNFSLKRGRGHGIGAIPLVAYLRLAARDEQHSTAGQQLLVLFRNRESEICRAAGLSLL